ncbi:MAG: EamA family transporter [Clostridia bacterium]|nr:EamA family transporter [Clostridia bacterium]
MQSWVILVLIYGLAKGFREALKKKALEKNSILEVLFFYTFIAFLFILGDAKEAAAMPPLYLVPVFIKSALIVAAWLCAFHSIAHLPISLYGILDLARVFFASALGVIVLHEKMTAATATGMFFIVLGMLLVNTHKKGAPAEHFAFRYTLLVLISCFLNAVSGLMDKVLTQSVTSAQLQFWYMLFMTLLYLIILIVKRVKINWRALRTNWWIPILSLLFIIADRCLFIANSNPESRVTVMTLLKQSSVVVTILLGKALYNEKRIAFKLVCAGIVVLGLVISVS